MSVSLSTFDATEPCPAFVDFGGFDVEPLAVNAAEFFDLFVQKTGQDNAAALFGTRGKHFAEHTQGIGQNVGDNDIKLALRQAVRQVELRVDVVLRGIVFAGADGLFVNIYADGGACAEFEGGNGQNAGAAAVVQYAFAAFELRVEPFEAEAGGRMAAGAEGKARVELQVDGVAVGRFVPRRGNPQAVGNLNRVELRLG